MIFDKFMYVSKVKIFHNFTTIPGHVCCPHHPYLAVQAELIAQSSGSVQQEVPHGGAQQRQRGNPVKLTKIISAYYIQKTCQYACIYSISHKQPVVWDHSTTWHILKHWVVYPSDSQ